MFSTFARRIRSAIRSPSEKHLAARQYWLSCSNTFLAGDPTYYDRQEVELRALLSSLPSPVSAALDVGCGNGRFSFVLADYAQQLTAFDLAHTLIEEARANHSKPNIEFQQRDLEDGLPRGAYGLVACMGVTSTIIDDPALGRLLQALRAATTPGGMLITKDSLSEKEDQLLTWNSYVTMYRNLSRYEVLFKASGFELVQRRQLAHEPERSLINHLYMWRRAK